MPKHLESCVRRAVKVRSDREHYDGLHPMYCEECEGWGGTITVTDPSMSKTSEVGEDSAPVDDCEYCIGQGRCPRCASDYNADVESVDFDDSCTFCGFVLGETEGKPYPHVCICGDTESENIIWRRKSSRKRNRKVNGKKGSKK